MKDKVRIRLADPSSPEAKRMMDSLWIEIQTRYGFQAPNPMQAEDFSGAKSGFWIAEAEGNPVGSVALVLWSEKIAELDVMYVHPDFRRFGVASGLVRELEEFARKNGYERIRLRAGAPQPEAISFYENSGYERIESFGRWASDETAWCYEKIL